MAIQYDDLVVPADGGSLLDPREIFTILPNKDATKIVNAWPTLSAAIRAEITALVAGK